MSNRQSYTGFPTSYKSKSPKVWLFLCEHNLLNWMTTMNSLDGVIYSASYITYYSYGAICSYNRPMWRLTHSRNIVSDCLLPSSVIQIKHLHSVISYRLQYIIIGHLHFPLVSWVSALFYARRILHSASLLRLSVRPSVSRKVCPRRRAVSLRQLSFLWNLVHVITSRTSLITQFLM